MTPTGPAHGRIDNKIGRRLGTFVEQGKLGEVYTNTGFILARAPDVVRAPDEAFVSAAKLASHPPPQEGFWEVAPDLAVEVVSPNDTADEIGGKVADYLVAGVQLIWIIYPRLKQVHVYMAGTDPRVLSGDDVLIGEPLLPDFRLPIRDLW